VCYGRDKPKGVVKDNKADAINSEVPKEGGSAAVSSVVLVEGCVGNLKPVGGIIRDSVRRESSGW
jgi:hypothetical protein